LKSLDDIGSEAAATTVCAAGRQPMALKFFVAAALFVTVPIVAFAQSKPTIEDARKLVETISSDKDKLKAYCEISKLHE
jgi:hypothetical protein